MKKEMLVNVLQPEECRIAILEDGILEELYVERASHESYVNNIYKGKIVNIDPSIQAAFVDFGIGRNGFLHISDVDPIYYRHLTSPDRDSGRRRQQDSRHDQSHESSESRPSPRRRPPFEPVHIPPGSSQNIVPPEFAENEELFAPTSGQDGSVSEVDRDSSFGASILESEEISGTDDYIKNKIDQGSSSNSSESSSPSDDSGSNSIGDRPAHKSPGLESSKKPMRSAEPMSSEESSFGAGIDLPSSQSPASSTEPPPVPPALRGTTANRVFRPGAKELIKPIRPETPSDLTKSDDQDSTSKPILPSEGQAAEQDIRQDTISLGSITETNLSSQPANPPDTKESEQLEEELPSKKYPKKKSKTTSEDSVSDPKSKKRRTKRNSQFPELEESPFTVNYPEDDSSSPKANNPKTDPTESNANDSRSNHDTPPSLPSSERRTEKKEPEIEAGHVSAGNFVFDPFAPNDRFAKKDRHQTETTQTPGPNLPSAEKASHDPVRSKKDVLENETTLSSEMEVVATNDKTNNATEASGSSDTDLAKKQNLGSWNDLNQNNLDDITDSDTPAARDIAMNRKGIPHMDMNEDMNENLIPEGEISGLSELVDENLNSDNSSDNGVDGEIEQAFQEINEIESILDNEIEDSIPSDDDELHMEIADFDEKLGSDEFKDLMEEIDASDEGSSSSRGGYGRERGRSSHGRRDRMGSRRGGRHSGPRDNRDSGPKPLIQDIFKRGQEVIVQVIKEGIGSKGPTLRTSISIAGRYLVLMPSLNRLAVSRKIPDEGVRHRLKDALGQLSPPKGIGFIIRTAAIDRNIEELQKDLAYLVRLWEVFCRRVKKLPAPVEIYRESDMITRTIRDNFASDVEQIWVDEEKSYQQAQEFINVIMPRYSDRIKFYNDTEPIFEKFKIEKEISQLMEKKVPLPMGGSIVIEQTEALVAIDVNSGNFRADNNAASETAYQMNLNAAREIARQLRLRDLGGVIVNDFIDMKEERHRRGVENALRDALRRDRARTKILRISAFGVIEMTRQRIRPSLERSNFIECPHCRGIGSVKTSESMSIELIRYFQLAASKQSIRQVQASVHTEVANFLLNKKRKDIIHWEEIGKMQITILGIPHVSPEHLALVCYDINGLEVRLITTPLSLPSYSKLPLADQKSVIPSDTPVSRESTKDHSRSFSRESSRESSKDHSRESSRDHSRESSRDHSRSFSKKEDRGGDRGKSAHDSSGRSRGRRNEGGKRDRSGGRGRSRKG